MKPRKSAYLAHRWLGLLVSLQLLAWSTGGFVFSILPLDLVRGEREIGSPPFDALSQGALDALPDPVRELALELKARHPDLASIALRDRGLGPSWEIQAADGTLIARVIDETGQTRPLLTPDEAATIAARDFLHDADVVETTLIESDPPIEYRSGPLPAYRVALEHSRRPHIYIDARSGEVTARRNRPWRIFDFFWMLHTMDYSGRDDFNHPLLTAFSLLAMATSATGLSLWGWRIVNRARARLRRRVEL